MNSSKFPHSSEPGPAACEGAVRDNDEAANAPVTIPPKRFFLRQILRWGRLAFAAALLIFVFSKVDWQQVSNYRHQIHWGWLLMFCALLPFSLMVNSRKWQILLQARGHHVNFWYLLGLCNLGQFYNTVLPSTVGGDVIRAVGLQKKIHSRRIAFASMVVERFTGASVLAVLGIAAVMWAFPEMVRVQQGGMDGRVLVGLTLAAALIYFGVMAAVLEVHITRLLRRIFGHNGPLDKPITKIENFKSGLHAYRHHRAAIGRSLAYSLLFHLQAVLQLYCGCRMLGEDVSLVAIAVATPIILLVALLPISPGGYGIVQWAYMVSFVALGIASEDKAATLGVTVSLLMSVRGIVLNSLGYALFTGFDWNSSGQSEIHAPVRNSGELLNTQQDHGL